MSVDVLIVCSLAIFALIFFVSEFIRADLVAIIVMSLLALFGVITPDEAVSGFSNSATLTVMNMFILSAAVFKTGALNLVGQYKFKDYLCIGAPLCFIFLILASLLLGL